MPVKSKKGDEEQTHGKPEEVQVYVSVISSVLHVLANIP